MHHEDIVARQRERCRALRRESSETEELLWRRLRHRQVRNAKFRRQHPVGPYILDFYCHEARLAVELDGGQHGDDAQAQYDQNRTLYLEEMGIQVFRFWNNEVLTRTDDVLATIWSAVERSCSNYENGTPHPTPLPKGEGEEEEKGEGEEGRGCEELRKKEPGMLDRVSDLRRRLQECGCDAFVSFSPPANRYLTGFRGTTSAVVVTLEESLLLCDFRYTELARRQVRGYEVVEVKGTIELRAGEALAKRGVLKAAFDPTVLTMQQMSVLRGGFTGTLEPAAQLLAAMRMVKTADEIAHIRTASELAEAALESMLGELRVGITEREAAMRLDAEFRRRGAEGPSFDTMVLFGPHSSQPHGAPGDTALAPGDIVLVDCGCIRDGYCSDLTRTMAFGTIPATWFEEIYEVTLRAQQAALAAVKPGAIGREVDAVARNIIRGAGYGSHFGHGLGHGVGLEIHEPPRLNTESETVLEAGMIVTVEPGIYLPRRGGVRIEDLVAVTADGCTILTQSSTKLRVLSI